MPAGDRTGPLGLGPRTGRGLGYCSGYTVPGYANPLPGRGFWGRGFGYGQGFRRGYRCWGYFAPYSYPYEPLYRPSYTSTQDEITILTEQAEEIENELKAIRERISELEKQPQKEEK